MWLILGVEEVGDVVNLGQLSYLRPALPADDALLFELFSTTWESEVAALPNQQLARHVLRIQHIAQERRFATRYAGHRRLVVSHDGTDVGRLYLLQTGETLHVVDVTLLPEHRSRGVATRVLRDLMGQAREEGQSLTARVARTNEPATALFARLGFSLTSVDDLDRCFEWQPVTWAPAAPTRSPGPELSPVSLSHPGRGSDRGSTR